MEHDFFVYPDCAVGSEIKLHDYKSYIDSILESARKSQSPFIVGKGEIVEVFIPKERRLATRRANTGTITEQDLKSLAREINPRDRFRVHGGHLGKCASTFALQLFALVYKGEYWGSSEWGSFEAEQIEMAMSYMVKGELSRSNIRYGNVLEDRVSSRKFSDRAGLLIAQFVDGRTRIF